MKLFLWIGFGATAIGLGTGGGPAAPGGGGTAGAGVGCNPCIEVILKCTDAQTGAGIPFIGRVGNCGDTDLLNVQVTHDNGTPLDPDDDVDVLSIPLLARGELQTFSGTYTPSVPPGSPSTLVATGVGSPPPACKLADVTHSQSATCLASCNPCMEVILKCSDADAGSQIPFIGRVGNCGNVDLMNVMVAHDNGTPDNPADDVVILLVPLLPPDSIQAFSGTYPPSVPAGQPSTLIATGLGTPAAICELKDVTATMSATCTQAPGGGGEGCTPGFWKNHEELWDQAGDPIAAAAGFTTDTSFNDFFGLTPAESGFPDTFTMHDGASQGGGGPNKLARHGVPGLLNVAAGLDYDLPDGIDDAAELAQAIADAYLADAFEPLASQIADGNEADCPF